MQVLAEENESAGDGPQHICLRKRVDEREDRCDCQVRLGGVVESPSSDNNADSTAVAVQWWQW